MAKYTTFARPYARAAFDYARADKSLAAWSEGLATAAAVIESPKVEAILAAPSTTSSQKADVLVKLCGVDGKLANFIGVLSDNKRLALLPEISSLFNMYKAEFEKAVDVTVSTAFPISDTVEDNLAKALKAKLDRDVKLSTEIDESLIGGAVIRAGDTVIDLSLIHI